MRTFIEDIITEAGARVQDLFGHVTVSAKGSDKNTVTEADIQSESFIRDAIKEKYPHHLFLGEESEDAVSLKSDHLWIVDPLDGTNNFSCGLPHYSVSIAYARGGDIVAGAVYDPSRKELFSAEKNHGAFLNGKRLQCSPRRSMGQALICTGFYYDRGDMMRSTLKSIERLFDRDIRGLRRTGSAALDLSWTAAGRFDGFFEYELHPWDFAAGLLLVREAGGRTCDTEGRAAGLNSGGIIAGSSLLFDAFSSVVIRSQV
jgi:myo-inositol-1(or 4)-monophosphatase